MSSVALLFAFLLLAKFAVERILEWLNRLHVKANADTIPEAYRDSIDAETYAKSVKYTLERNAFGAVSDTYDTLLLALVLFTGVLPWFYGVLEGWLGASALNQAFILFLIGFVLSFFDLPFEYYDQFVLEEKFGFNKSTVGLWITDKVKGTVISLVFGVGVIWLILALVRLHYWWLWAFLAVFLLQLIMMVIYPMFIMKWFNKFDPLPEGDLKDRLMALAERTGFSARTIYVMDGSKRSGHSNAYFTGFGKFRQIVLFDTLIEQMEEDELEAVLAHEIGHYKLGHIPKLLIIAAISMLLAFYIMDLLLYSPWFVEAFGFTYEPGKLAPVLLLFGLISGLVTFWISPLMNVLSRKHEYEADAFARNVVNNDPQPLIGALRKLHEKNLRNLTPHPLFSAFYYSHPTLPEREAALRHDTGVATG